MVADRGIEWWRGFFANSGADIWTVIVEAMLLAAADYPAEFKDRRSEIGEVLFSRSLLDLHLRISPSTKCSEVTDSAPNVTAPAAAAMDPHGRADGISPNGRSAMTGIAKSSKSRAETGPSLPPDHRSVADLARFQIDDDAAEALSDQLEEEDAILRDLYSIRDTLACSDQSESVLFDALRRLQLMDVDVRLLQKTMIGREVTPMKKHSSERVSKLAKHLISHWKRLVQLYSSEMEETAVTEPAQTEMSAEIPEAGLPEPPFDAGALWASSTTEFSQLVNFMHEAAEHDMPKDKHNPPFSVENNAPRDRSLSSSTSRSESFLTDSSDPAAVQELANGAPHSRFNGEKKSAKLVERSNQQGNGISKEVTKSGPGRPFDDPSEAKTGVPKTKNSGIANKIDDSKAQASRPTSVLDHRQDSSSLQRVERNQLDKKLEIAKRKLHQGYEEAEKAKKQRTIRVLDIPDLPKDGQNAVRGKGSNNHHHHHAQQKSGHRSLLHAKQKLRR